MYLACQDKKPSLRYMLVSIYAMLVFISMMPFFVWGQEWIILALFLVFIFLGICSVKELVIDKMEFYFIVLFFLFFLTLIIPIREYDEFSYKYFFSLGSIVLGVVFLREKLVCSWAILKNILFFVSLVSLLSQFLFAIGAYFPDFLISQNFRPASTDVYRLYYGIVWLSTEVRNLGGVAVLRNSGWFGEPGHFGIYICLLLSIDPRPLKGFKNIVLGLAVFSTLSTAAILVYCLIILFKERTYIICLMVVFLLGFVCFFSDATEVVLEKFSADGGILASRATYSLEATNFSLMDSFLGNGRNYLSIIDRTSSNYDAFFAQYGFFSFFFFVLIFAFVLGAKNELRKKASVYFFVAALVFLHRSWMVDSLYYWFPALVAFESYRYEVRI